MALTNDLQAGRDLAQKRAKPEAKRVDPNITVGGSGRGNAAQIVMGLAMELNEEALAKIRLNGQPFEAIVAAAKADMEAARAAME